jgi:hypothetical protein
MGGRSLVAAGVLIWTGALVACTTGTTPDCSDAQCLPVLEVGDGEAGSVVDAEAGEAGSVRAGERDGGSDGAGD